MNKKLTMRVAAFAAFTASATLPAGAAEFPLAASALALQKAG